MSFPSSITVQDANGDPQEVRTPLATGRAAETSSSPVVLSTEDKAALDLIAAAPDTLTGQLVGTASAELLAADAARTVAEIQNVSATASIAVKAGGAAVLNAAGSWMIPPLGTLKIVGPLAALSIQAIATAAGTPVTIASN